MNGPMLIGVAVPVDGGQTTYGHRRQCPAGNQAADRTGLDMRTPESVPTSEGPTAAELVMLRTRAYARGVRQE
jgi:hypothetical protein